MTEKQKETQAALLNKLIDQFAAADTCWFSSIRPDGRPHLAPIWHVWHEGLAYVCTPAGSVRARNVAHDPRVSLSLPDPYNVFILEGDARPAPEMEDALQPLFLDKYNWDISSDVKYDLILAITPRKIMAWGDHGEGRWHF